MVSGATIQAKVNYGLGKAGNAAGFQYSWYRPSGTGPVIVSGNLLGSIEAYIVPNKQLQPTVSDWGKADRYAAFDPTNFMAGDYLVGVETMFVAEIVPLAGAVRLAICNVVFTWSQTAPSPAGPGFSPGVATATVAASGWPGWITAAERRSPGELKVPGAVEMPTASILLPASLPGQPLRGDTLTTAEAAPVRWTVQSAILSANGWQITAVRAGA